MTQPSIRNLTLDDVPTVVQMVRDSFDSRLRPFMIYGQHGMVNFLSVPLEFPECKSDRQQLVMEIEGAIVGFADFRLLGDGAGFLSYICVASHARGQGVATRLIDFFLASHPDVTELSLDVFRENSSARALYSKLGFESKYTSAWVTRSVPDPSGSVAIPALPASIAAFRAHGFCELGVKLGQDSFNVGLIGAQTVRCPSTSSFENDALLSGLRGVFPHVDRAFAIVLESDLPSLRVRHELVTLADRMQLKRQLPLARNSSHEGWR